MELARSRSVWRVPVLRRLRVATIQASPAILDADASVPNAVRLLGEAVAQGAELVSLYPSSPLGARRRAVLGRERHGIHAVVDVNERERDRPGALCSSIAS